MKSLIKVEILSHTNAKYNSNVKSPNEYSCLAVERHQYFILGFKFVLLEFRCMISSFV